MQYAEEDEIFAQDFGIPTRKVYSGELCPDHCNVMVLGDALQWARRAGCNVLLVETAGLCLRCSPYVDGGLGLIVLEATSGINLPLKVGPMLSLADMAVVTKIDRVSQAEREVFRARIQDVAPGVRVREVNALYGIGIDPLVDRIRAHAGRRGYDAAARQPAGGHLHDLRRQEGDRLAVPLRRGARAGKPELLPGRVSYGDELGIYFDHSATTPLDPRVTEAMLPFLGGALRQPLQPALGRAAGARGGRCSAAAGGRAAERQPDEMVFTASGTEADNMALVGVAEQCAAPTTATSSPARSSIRQSWKRCKLSGTARCAR